MLFGGREMGLGHAAVLNGISGGRSRQLAGWGSRTEYVGTQRGMGRRRRWLAQTTVSAVTENRTASAELWTRKIDWLTWYTEGATISRKQFRTKGISARTRLERIIFAAMAAFVAQDTWSGQPTRAYLQGYP